MFPPVGSMVTSAEMMLRRCCVCARREATLLGSALIGSHTHCPSSKSMQFVQLLPHLEIKSFLTLSLSYDEVCFESTMKPRYRVDLRHTGLMMHSLLVFSRVELQQGFTVFIKTETCYQPFTKLYNLFSKGTNCTLLKRFYIGLPKTVDTCS